MTTTASFRKGQNLRLPINKIGIGDEIDGKPISSKTPNGKFVTITFEDGTSMNTGHMGRTSVFRPLGGQS